MSHPLYTLTVRLIAALMFAAALTYLLTRAFVPSGRLTVVDDLRHPAPYVSLPKPTERTGDVEHDGGIARTPFIGSPIFFDLKPPQGFDGAQVTLAYRNDGQQVAEIGALASSLDEQFVVKPLENRVIDALPWKRVSSGDVTLYQRHPTYASVDEFFRNPPKRAALAVYRADARIPYVIDGYAPSSASREIEVSLRGHHRMHTYVKDEPLQFTFFTQDMNRLDGADPVTVSVYRGLPSGQAGDDREPVARVVLADDGDTGSDQKSSGLRAIPITVTDPKEGDYQIEFTATADTFIRRIVTTQQKLVFADKMYLGDHVGYSDKVDPLTVRTDGQHVIVRTPHVEAMQDVKVGEAIAHVDQPNVRYETVTNGKGLTSVTTPKRDLLVETAGLFALTPAEYFNPLPYEMQWFTVPKDLDDRGIDFVLSSYEPPARDGQTRIASASFDLTKLAKTEDGAYRFAVTLPGIDVTRYPFNVESVTFALQRPPTSLWRALPRLFDAFRPATARIEEVVPDGRTYGEWPE